MHTSMQREDVWVGSQRLPGELQTSPEAAGMVLFVHGSGSSRTSPRNRVGAVVSRGGRPDLAEDHLGRVQAPTLLIVGGDDTEVLGLNRLAARRLHCLHRTEIVPGATHLVEEPGALDAAADLAARWFAGHLAHRPPS
jgi:hypothetical protein